MTDKDIKKMTYAELHNEIIKKYGENWTTKTKETISKNYDDPLIIEWWDRISQGG